MSKCTPKPPETFLRLLECVSQRVYRHFAIENMTENDLDTLSAALRPPSLTGGAYSHMKSEILKTLGGGYFSQKISWNLGVRLFSNFRLRRKNTVYTPKNSIFVPKFFACGAKWTTQFGVRFFCWKSQKCWGRFFVVEKISWNGWGTLIRGGAVISNSPVLSYEWSVTLWTWMIITYRYK